MGEWRGAGAEFPTSARSGRATAGASGGCSEQIVRRGLATATSRLGIAVTSRRTPNGARPSGRFGGDCVRGGPGHFTMPDRGTLKRRERRAPGCGRHRDLECGEWSPLWRRRLVAVKRTQRPRIRGSATAGASRGCPKQIVRRGLATATSRLGKAVTSHRTPNGARASGRFGGDCARGPGAFHDARQANAEAA